MLELPLPFEYAISDRFGRIPTTGGELEDKWKTNFDLLNFALQEIQNSMGGAGYESFSILSFINNVNFIERGSTVNSVRFDWSYSGIITEQSITPDAPTLNANERTRTVSGLSITNNRDWTLKANDGTTEIIKTTSLVFLDSMYYGVSNDENISNAGILGLTSELGYDFEQKRFFNCSGGRFIYLAWPTAWGSNPIFRVGGIAFSAMEKRTIPGFQNSKGRTVSLDVYRVEHRQFGSNIMVEVFKS